MRGTMLRSNSMTRRMAGWRRRGASASPLPCIGMSLVAALSEPRSGSSAGQRALTAESRGPASHQTRLRGGLESNHKTAGDKLNPGLCEAKCDHGVTRNLHQ